MLLASSYLTNQYPLLEHIMRYQCVCPVCIQIVYLTRAFSAKAKFNPDTV